MVNRLTMRFLRSHTAAKLIFFVMAVESNYKWFIDVIIVIHSINGKIGTQITHSFHVIPTKLPHVTPFQVRSVSHSVKARCLSISTTFRNCGKSKPRRGVKKTGGVTNKHVWLNL
jgi:hypothetical protein